jgi:hypothetical protein
MTGTDKCLNPMGIAGYVSVCVQLYCVGFHCLSLYVSAYMAIFMCVGYFIFNCLKDSASLVSFFFFLPFSPDHTLHVSICVSPVLFFFLVFVVSLCVCVYLLALSLLFVCTLLLTNIIFLMFPVPISVRGLVNPRA